MNHTVPLAKHDGHFISSRLGVCDIPRNESLGGMVYCQVYHQFIMDLSCLLNRVEPPYLIPSIHDIFLATIPKQHVGHPSRATSANHWLVFSCSNRLTRIAFLEGNVGHWLVKGGWLEESWAKIILPPPIGKGGVNRRKFFWGCQFLDSQNYTVFGMVPFHFLLLFLFMNCFSLLG